MRCTLCNQDAPDTLQLTKKDYKEFEGDRELPLLPAVICDTCIHFFVSKAWDDHPPFKIILMAVMSKGAWSDPECLDAFALWHAGEALQGIESAETILGGEINWGTPTVEFEHGYHELTPREKPKTK